MKVIYKILFVFLAAFLGGIVLKIAGVEMCGWFYLSAGLIVGEVTYDWIWNKK